MNGPAPYLSRAAGAVPPQLWFLVSATFHSLGPSLAVLLFPRVGVLGVAWFRITGAAALFACWTAPVRVFLSSSRETRIILGLLGLTLALMNSTFYLAIERLPLGLVAAIEFLGVIVVALYGLRSLRNLAALGAAVTGVFLLIELRLSTDPAGLAMAAADGLLFVVYIVLGHRLAGQGGGEGVNGLGAAMAVASMVVLPIGLGEARSAFSDPVLILAGLGVGVCSSVIPYGCDQLAMSRLPRNTFALMLALRPAFATLMGALVLQQIPTIKEIVGVLLVMVGVAVHRPKT